MRQMGPPEYEYFDQGCYFCGLHECQQDCIDPKTGEFWPKPEPLLAYGPWPDKWESPSTEDDCPF
jgi:hypothetical protein